MNRGQCELQRLIELPWRVDDDHSATIETHARVGRIDLQLCAQDFADAGLFELRMEMLDLGTAFERVPNSEDARRPTRMPFSKCIEYERILAFLQLIRRI